MKTKNFIIAGLAGIILAACAEDAALENKAPQRDDNSLKIEVTDEFTAAATRADYSGFPSTTFETGDALGLYAFDGSSYVVSNIRFVKQSDGSWLPDEEVPYIEEYTYYAYFPYRATAYTPSASGTVDDVDTKFGSFVSDASNYFWQADQSTKAGYTYSNLMIAKGTVTDVDEVEGTATVKFTMAHKRGLAVFTKHAEEATFTGNIPYLIDNAKYFLMKPSTSTSFTDDDGTYSLSAANGKCKKHKVTVGTDLSMVDNAGNARASMTTANCYLVHATGKYMIPLVYGNAIKNGNANTTAYCPGGSATYYIANFVNHNDDAITGPWITKSTSDTGMNRGMGLTAASAELIWQDAAGLITSVSVGRHYLKFTVGTFTGGNALIAVKDGSGTILWSWHIWATDESLSSTTSVNTGSHIYYVAPVNLGWVPTGGGGKQGYCTYYQWGRKDPFIPCNGTPSNGTDKTVYNINGVSVTRITYQNVQSLSGLGPVTIGNNIKNPTIAYGCTDKYPYSMASISDVYRNLWDATCSSYGNVTSATVKTIYDPCPPGFCVPTGNLWYHFGGDANELSYNERNDSNWDSTNRGKTWTLNGASIFFPAIGSRHGGSNFEVSSVGNSSDYWAATHSEDNTSAQHMELRSSLWQWNSNVKYAGFCVRPVAE